MKHNKKKVAITAAVLTCLLTAVGLSRPGRMVISKALSLVNSAISTSQSPPDVERRARTAHGWRSGLDNMVARGTITYYRNDQVIRQAPLTVYYKYPGWVRVEEGITSSIEVWGFGPGGEWRTRPGSLTEAEKREIRQWLRIWPQRLFLARAATGRYRELVRRPERLSPPLPGRGPSEPRPPRVLWEVEVIDRIPPAGGGGGVRDERALYYLADSQDSTISSAGWIEPDDPRDSIDSPGARTKQVKMDFSRWRRFDGVLLPTELTRWVAGRADITIDVSEVLLNQQLSDTIFQNPNR